MHFKIELESYDCFTQIYTLFDFIGLILKKFEHTMKNTWLIIVLNY